MKRMLLAGVLAAAAALPLAQSAQAEPAAPPVPDAIAVGDGHKPFLIGHATGMQIYACQAIPAGHRWGLLAPRANLYDDKGKLLATHYGGPTWEARDGSTFVGRRDAGVPVDPTAIDWLRLSAARPPAAGPDGDRLADTTYIQRINTVGGLAPAPADCNADTAGTQIEVPYTADYVFFKATGA
jgi:Protein of unknown function (DUF3455)